MQNSVGKRQKTGAPLRCGGDERVPRTFFRPAAEFQEALQGGVRWCQVVSGGVKSSSPSQRL